MVTTFQNYLWRVRSFMSDPFDPAPTRFIFHVLWWSLARNYTKVTGLDPVTLAPVGFPNVPTIRNPRR